MLALLLHAHVGAWAKAIRTGSGLLEPVAIDCVALAYMDGDDMGVATISFADICSLRGAFSALAFFVGVALTATVASATTVDGIAKYNAGRFDDALKTLGPLANAGDPVAQCFVARIYNAATGGVRRDLALAKQYAERSLLALHAKSNEGVANAQECLGWLRVGRLVGEPNLSESFQLAKRSAEQGNVDGQRSMGYSYRSGLGVAQDHTEANRWFEKASRSGSVEAKFALALAQRKGWGVTKNELAAGFQFKALAEAGWAIAQSQYAYMLRTGEGVQQDYAAAREWYERAAAQFDVWAQNDLGVMYQFKLGVAQNLPFAFEWYRRSADQGYSWAQANLGRMYFDGQGVVKDEAKAVAYVLDSADQNNPYGQFLLGRAFELGSGVPKDALLALVWYRRSAGQSTKDVDRATANVINDAAAAAKRLTGKDPAAPHATEQRVETIGEN